VHVRDPVTYAAVAAALTLVALAALRDSREERLPRRSDGRAALRL